MKRKTSTSNLVSKTDSSVSSNTSQSSNINSESNRNNNNTNYYNELEFSSLRYDQTKQSDAPIEIERLSNMKNSKNKKITILDSTELSRAESLNNSNNMMPPPRSPRKQQVISQKNVVSLGLGLAGKGLHSKDQSIISRKKSKQNSHKPSSIYSNSNSNSSQSNASYTNTNNCNTDIPNNNSTSSIASPNISNPNSYMDYMEPGKFSESGNTGVIRSPKIPSRASFALRRSSSVSNEESKVDLNSVNIRSISDPHPVKDTITDDGTNNDHQHLTPPIQYSATMNIHSPPALPPTLSKISSASSLPRITSSHLYTTNAQTSNIIPVRKTSTNSTNRKPSNSNTTGGGTGGITKESKLFKRTRNINILRKETSGNYIKKIMDGTLSLKKYKHLESLLGDTNNHKWIQRFIEDQGDIALAVVLHKINKKSTKSNEELDEESMVLSCLRCLLNSEDLFQTRNASSLIRYITPSLLSVRLSTRILVTGMLALLIAREKTQASDALLSSFQSIASIYGTVNCFIPWIESADQAIEQYQNELESMAEKFEFDDDDDDWENSPKSKLYEYTLLTVFLISSIVSTSEDVSERTVIRNQLFDAGLLKLFDRSRLLNYDPINDLIANYEVLEDDDFKDEQLHNENILDVSLNHSNDARLVDSRDFSEHSEPNTVIINNSFNNYTTTLDTKPATASNTNWNTSRVSENYSKSIADVSRISIKHCRII
ncbi:unnamed protein product [[Candida] boidinii]|uniref:Unnamed protein product n=1 Tax=Candida boidinii TaxID=5477 RepID=A0A9W6WC09_CANBO|nr:unnamed protein product [[Candida] boidinii]